MTSKELSATLRAAWENPFSSTYDPRHLLLQAADEIDRLALVCKTYAEVCAISSQEIKALREAAGVRQDPSSDPSPAPEAPNWERPAYRTLGPSTWTNE